MCNGGNILYFLLNCLLNAEQAGGFSMAIQSKTWKLALSHAVFTIVYQKSN